MTNWPLSQLLCAFLSLVVLARATCASDLTVAMVPNKSARAGEPSHLLVLDGLSPSQQEALSRAQQLDKHFRVYVKSIRDAGTSQPVLGVVKHAGNKLEFMPRYPFGSGIEYIAVLELSSQPAIEKSVSIPAKVLEPEARVEVLYPTAEILPQNLLKFYVHFSVPMSQGDAYRYIELKTEQGRVLEHPFLEIDEELWDRSGKRLTLLLDPGRVKRGLVPREEDGPILESGHRYQLTISDKWPDANGTPMAKGFTKKFVVSAEDFGQPNPANWQITTPKSRTTDGLVFEFPEPLDHATFIHGVTIENGAGEAVRGEFSFAQHEMRAIFKPLKEWKSGLYDVRISTLIEDLCGNSIQRPFEVDRFDQVDNGAVQRRTLTIEIR